jgi:hypothetical protein
MRKIELDERPEKKVVKALMVVFGIMCLITSGWWAIFLLKSPENQNIFWGATLFMLAFGSYQVYAGLGFAARYIIFDGEDMTIRQNSLLPPKKFTSHYIENIEIRRMDILIIMKDSSRYRLKLGLKYPDLGESIRDEITLYANEKEVRIEYNYN